MKNKVTPTQRALNLWAVILIVWAVYRAKFKLPEWFDEFIAKPLVFVFPVYYFIRRVEKREFLKAIDFKLKFPFSDILLSVAIGIVFSFSAILANIVKFEKLDLIKLSIGWQEFLLVGSLALATAMSEEILSRGFVLKRLYDESKNIYSSAFYASILFFFLHVPILFTNSRLSGDLLLLIMGTDLLLSLVNSFIFLDRKNLVVPILIHAFYNLSLIIFI